MAQIFATPQLTIQSLLSRIETGELALPELQRPLVWKSAKVRDLFDSLKKGYPIGYVMLWNCLGYEKFKKIGNDNKQYKSPKQVIIDGQQRLTTLYSVIKNKKVVFSDYSAGKFNISYKPLEDRFEVQNKSTENSEWIADITEIFTTKNPTKFVNEFTKKLREEREKKDLELTEDEIDTIQNNINDVANLVNYGLSVVEIEATADEEMVADIFVRVNSEGVQLKQNDFILTLLSINWEEGRKNIEKFCESSIKPSKSKNSSYNCITEISAQDIIRVVIAYVFYRGRLKYGYRLLRGADFEKKGEINPKLKEERFNTLQKKLPDVIDYNNWKEFIKSIIASGYVSGSLIKSKVAIFYCYTFYLIGKYKFKMDSKSIMHLIALWFFFVTLTSLYTGSFETELETEINSIKDLKSEKEFKKYFINRIEERFTNDYFNTTLVGSEDLGGQGKDGNNSFNAYVASLIVLNSNVLFSHTSTSLSKFFDDNISGNRNSLEKHHLFPKKYLEKKKYPEKKINQMANYSFIDWKDNADILDDAPDKYYPIIKKGLTKKEVSKMEDENALPHGWEKMKYDDFIRERKKLMAGIIKKAYEKLKKNVK